MSRSFPVKGLAELDRVLSAMPGNLRKNAYAAGLRAGAAVLRDEARARAPKEDGKLAKAIGSSSVRTNDDGTLSIQVRADPKKQHAYLALFAEYGVARHLIARTGAKEGRVAVRKAKEGTGTAQAGVMKIGPDFVSGIIEHPGHAAHPFMRPALDAKAGEAIAAFALRVRAYLEGKTGFALPMDDAA